MKTKSQTLIKLVLLTQFIFITLINISISQDFSSKHFKIEKLSSGVYAAIHSFGGYAICNSGIVDLGDKVLVFDTFLTVEAAKDLRKAAEAITGKKVTYVVNSHAHNDHIRGNQVFHPNSIIISTNNIREQIKKDEPERIQDEKEYAPLRLAEIKKTFEVTTDQNERNEYRMWIGYYKGMIQSHSELVTTLPDVTFEDSLEFHGSERTALLLAFSNAHTDEDVVLYLPKERIIFTGDLVFTKMHPYLPDGDPEGLKKTLNDLLKRQIDIVVPGHGDVGNSDEIVLMIDYVNMTDSLAHEIKKKGEPIDESDFENIPEPYTSWNFPNFFTMNMKFMVKRLK